MTSNNSLDKRSLFDRILSTISSINTVVTGVALVVLTVIFGWLVFGRYVLNATPTWVEQVSLLLIVYIGFLGGSVGVYQNTHLGVSVFREISPKPVRRVFELVSHLIMAGFALIMTIYGYKLTVFKWSANIPLLNISEGFRAIPIMLSGAFIFLFTIGHLIHFFKASNQEEND